MAFSIQLFRNMVVTDYQLQQMPPRNDGLEKEEQKGHKLLVPKTNKDLTTATRLFNEYLHWKISGKFQ